MNFGQALEFLKAGRKVARAGWNGKGMWLRLVDKGEWYVSGPDETEMSGSTFIGMKTADNKFVPWTASQTDVLAEDWDIVPNNQ
jgi:hypothetical protein